MSVDPLRVNPKNVCSFSYKYSVVHTLSLPQQKLQSVHLLKWIETSVLDKNTLTSGS